MKQLTILFAFALIVLSGNLYAQDLRNASGSKTGKIESAGPILSAGGTKIVNFERDGTVRNDSGTKIGKIDSDGSIRNASGTKTGSASGVRKEWAAVTFFFY
jgi:hypothetical protein